MKKLCFKRLLIALSFIACLSSCTKEVEKPELEDGRSTVIKDLPGDVGNTVGSGIPFTPFYFSFKTAAKVDESKKVSTEWDIAFAKEYNSYVSINNGTSPIRGSSVTQAGRLVVDILLEVISLEWQEQG